MTEKNPQLIDSHSHLNFMAFDEDRESIIDQTLNNNIWMINVGAGFDSSRKAVEIAQGHVRGVYAAIGVHPIHVEDESYSQEAMWDLASNNEKIVAVGEIGLDYYHLESKKGKLKNLKSISKAKKKQQQIFFEQLNLARMLNLPIIFHCRHFKNYDSHKDLLRVLEKFAALYKDYELRGVMHCYTGNLALAKIYQKLGLYFGITGVATFSSDYDEVIKNIPLEEILVETDCPYLSPEPKRGQRNIPPFVKYTAEHIAKLKNIDKNKFFKQTVENTQRLFQLDKY